MEVFDIASPGVKSAVLITQKHIERKLMQDNVIQAIRHSWGQGQGLNETRLSVKRKTGVEVSKHDIRMEFVKLGRDFLR